MEGFTWLYIVWSIVPIGIAVLFWFNKGASQATWQGFSTKWYVGSQVTSVLHNPGLHQAVIQTIVLGTLTTVICVPIGVGFAIGIDRWRTRTSDGLNLVMIFSFVVPELLLAVALFMLVSAGADVHSPGDDGRGGRAGGLEHQLARNHRARAAGEHWAHLRGGGRRSWGVADGDDRSSAAAAADAGHLRQRGARLREHGQRFRQIRRATVFDRDHRNRCRCLSTQTSTAA